MLLRIPVRWAIEKMVVCDCNAQIYAIDALAPKQSGSANELKTVIDRYCVKTNRGSGTDTDLRSLDHV